MNKALRILLSTVLPLIWPVLSLLTHPQSQSSQPSPSSQQPQAQSPAPQKEDSVAEAARKAKAKKAVPAPGKVFTEDEDFARRGNSLFRLGLARGFCHRVFFLRRWRLRLRLLGRR